MYVKQGLKKKKKDADLCVHKLPKACRLMIYTEDFGLRLGNVNTLTIPLFFCVCVCDVVVVLPASVFHRETAAKKTTK